MGLPAQIRSVRPQILTEGDLVLFDRNNHKSLYNSALVMTGAKPVYLKTDRDPLGLIGPLVGKDLDEKKYPPTDRNGRSKKLKLNDLLD